MNTGQAVFAQIIARVPHWEFQRAYRACDVAAPRADALSPWDHFHAFRKTFQTLGVRSGVNQRAAQELLGHSDRRLTANVYTDVPALGLHAEVAKLPWLGGDLPPVSGVAADAQNGANPPCEPDYRDVLAQLIQLAQVAIGQQKAGSFEPAQVVEVAGVEFAKAASEIVALEAARLRAEPSNIVKTGRVW